MSHICTYRAVVCLGMNSLAFFMYVNKALLQFILHKLLSSNVIIFWNLLLFESAVCSLGVLPRVFSIFKLHYNCCDLKTPQFTSYIRHQITILITLDRMTQAALPRVSLPAVSVFPWSKV